jgi:ApaG protein
VTRSGSHLDARGSTATTRGVRIDVAPRFLPEQSGEDESWKGRRYLFAYRIRITNEGDQAVQLLSRHWRIVDADGEERHVRGDGVVGHQPHLLPGHAFEYESYCPLLTPWGTMEGEYTMRTADGEEFAARIARFYLVSE